MRCGRQIRDQSILIDGDARDFGAGGFEGQRGAVIAGILDDAERAARQIQPRRERQAFLDSGHDHDTAWIGDDAARRRQMIGDRGAQRRKSRRIAILGQTRAAAMRQVALQQAAPGFQRKQIGAGTARKEIEQQAVAAWHAAALCARADAAASACAAAEI